MKTFNESSFQSQFLQSLQRRNETSNYGKVLVSFFQRPAFNRCFVEKDQLRLRNLSSPDSHESGGLLFGRLESLYGCAEWAN